MMEQEAKLPPDGGEPVSHDGAKPRRALALQYDRNEDSAPRIVAEGTGAVADRILELARQHRVPVKEDPLLAEALAKLEIGETIPPELYVVVAEVFAWLYRLEEKGEGAG